MSTNSLFYNFWRGKSNCILVSLWLHEHCDCDLFFIVQIISWTLKIFKRNWCLSVIVLIFSMTQFYFGCLWTLIISTNIMCVFVYIKKNIALITELPLKLIKPLFVIIFFTLKVPYSVNFIFWSWVGNKGHSLEEMLRLIGLRINFRRVWIWACKIWKKLSSSTY